MFNLYKYYVKIFFNRSIPYIEKGKYISWEMNAIRKSFLLHIDIEEFLVLSTLNNSLQCTRDGTVPCQMKTTQEGKVVIQ